MTIPIPDLNFNLTNIAKGPDSITTGPFFAGMPQELRGQGAVLTGQPVLAGGSGMLIAAALVLGVVFYMRRFG